MEYPIALTALAKDDQGQPLVCSGCAHSASSAPFPGHPSGERPSGFCIRNVQREQWNNEHFKECKGSHMIDGKVVDCRHPAHGIWYNGEKIVTSPLPMDAYHSCDMLQQFQAWTKKAIESAKAGNE